MTNTGARLVESSNINRSLFNLHKVIDALNSKAAHVPYRESKLTRVLQDALGGKAHTLMIINLPPGVNFYHHVLNTLQFAAKSRNVVNKSPERQECAPQPESMEDRLAAFRHKKGLTPMRATPSMSSHKKRKLQPTPSASPKILKLLPQNQHQPLADLGVNTTEAANLLGLSGKLLLTPQRDVKQATILVEQGLSLQEAGQVASALQRFEAAAQLVATEQLSTRIQQMRAELGPGAEAVWHCAPPTPTQLEERKSEPGQTPLQCAGIREVFEHKLLGVLNSGCEEQLSTLKDIGPKRVAMVLSRLAEHGKFGHIHQLSEIGMSDKQVSNFLKKNVVLTV